MDIGPINPNCSRFKGVHLDFHSLETRIPIMDDQDKALVFDF